MFYPHRNRYQGWSGHRPLMRPVDGTRSSAAAGAQVDDGDVHFTFLTIPTLMGRVMVRAENLLHKIVLLLLP